MVSLEDKAQESVSCVRIKNADGTAYKATADDLVSYKNIGNDEFPIYGDWLPCEALDSNGKALGERYLECPSALAQELLEIGMETGTEFRLAECSKTSDEQWYIEVEEL